MAAVLASGPGAVLSHRSAAALWGIRPAAVARPEVTAPRVLRPRPGIELHRARIPSDELTQMLEVPVTTMPRTLLDLAAILRPHAVRRAVHEVEFRRLADPLSLDVLLMRYPERRGTGVIREILASLSGGLSLTRSELEERFLAFVEKAGLPRPEVNAHVSLPTGWAESGRLVAACPVDRGTGRPRIPRHFGRLRA